MLNPANRVLDVRNNAYFWPEKLTNFYKAYNDTTVKYDSIDVPVMNAPVQKMWVKRTLVPPTWVSAYAQWTIDNLAGVLSPNIKVENNFEADPGFPASYHEPSRFPDPVCPQDQRRHDRHPLDVSEPHALSGGVAAS